jgi:Protein of unknown function (DUF2992).
MDGKCTVYFEDPFWVGVFERNDECSYSVARYVFGGEPNDAELLQFCKTQFSTLSYSHSASPLTLPGDQMGFKRQQREIRKQMTLTGIGTYAQRVLKAEFQRSKQENKQAKAQDRDQEAQQRFQNRQAAKKQKHRGH